MCALVFTTGHDDDDEPLSVILVRGHFIKMHIICRCFICARAQTRAFSYTHLNSHMYHAINNYARILSPIIFDYDTSIYRYSILYIYPLRRYMRKMYALTNCFNIIELKVCIVLRRCYWSAEVLHIYYIYCFTRTIF